MTDEPRSSDERADHWDAAYTRGSARASWYQREPAVSLELIEALDLPHDAVVIDIGGGTSRLADELLELGFGDLTVLDLSESALAEVEARLGASPARLVCADVLSWEPDRTFDLWHDRAAFHFLVRPSEREAYSSTLHAALRPGGFVVLGAFAEDGPERCSGLPVVRYSPEALAGALGLDMLEQRRELHTTPGGVVQPFTWISARRAG